MPIKSEALAHRDTYPALTIHARECLRAPPNSMGPCTVAAVDWPGASRCGRLRSREPILRGTGELLPSQLVGRMPQFV
jgi:hypothetical protein